MFRCSDPNRCSDTSLAGWTFIPCFFFSRYFCGDTSLHGWQYIPRFPGAGFLGWLHRAAWFIVSISPFLILVFYLLAKQYRQYFSFKQINLPGSLWVFQPFSSKSIWQTTFQLVFSSICFAWYNAVDLFRDYYWVKIAPNLNFYLVRIESNQN